MLLDFHHLITGCTLCLTLLGGDSWHRCQNGHQYMIFLSAKKIKKYKVDRRSMSKVLDVKEKKMVDKATKSKFISMFQVFWSLVYLIWVSITAGVNSSKSSGLSSLYNVVHACLVFDSFINHLFSFLLTLATYRCSFEVRVVGGGGGSKIPTKMMEVNVKNGIMVLFLAALAALYLPSQLADSYL